MILLGLLLVALVCIVVGIVTTTAPWFIASLVASALAAVTLWYQHNKISAAPARTGAPASGTNNGDQVWVVDGRPSYHAYGCAIIAGQPAEDIPLSQAQEDGFIPCAVCTPSAAVT